MFVSVDDAVSGDGAGSDSKISFIVSGGA